VPTQLHIQWVIGFLSIGSSDGADVDRSSQSDPEFKNKWSYTSTPLYDFVAFLSSVPRVNEAVVK
jgi:hypothetical protein